MKVVELNKIEFVLNTCYDILFSRHFSGRMDSAFLDNGYSDIIIITIIVAVMVFRCLRKLLHYVFFLLLVVNVFRSIVLRIMVRNLPFLVGFEVLTVVVMKSTIFWDTMPCSALKINGRFGGTYRLHLQGRRISPARNLQSSACHLL
jgi:hypothetical protein